MSIVSTLFADMKGNGEEQSEDIQAPPYEDVAYQSSR